MADTEIVILREMLAHAPGFTSGTALAAKLGMSRVSVFLHIEKLRAQGFTFETAQSRGYRIAQTPADLHLALIHAHLTGRRDLEITLLDEVDSTNDAAARDLAAGRAAPFVILARRQTRGRGRLGRTWHSEPGGNLYSSFAFRPRLAPGRMAIFTLWMGVNLCELVANFTQLAPGVKWPNDLLFDGRKCGGLLTEARVDADRMHELVFGLGLNVNGPAQPWSGELARRATSLADQAGGPLDLNHFAAALIGRVLLAYEQFIEGDHVRTFADLWQRYDVLRGQPVALLHGNERITGTAMGIDDEGSLLIRGQNGRLKRFHAGDVTIEKRD
ncbi:MAG TPA: biotin--[acetyl-CoA-carboxylase] ligase [Opitutus sp.]|nr:biotin--[acetyl-CoA-carboxylase] ligase [Opitutus sp.]